MQIINQYPTKMKMKFFLGLIIISLQLGIMAQNPETEKSMEPTIRKVDKIQLIYYNHTGPYQQAFSNFGQLMGYIQQNQLPIGPNSIGIYYDDPETVPENELRSEVGFMLMKPVEGSDNFKYKEIPAGKAVSIRYTSWEEISPAYEAIGKYIAENNINTVPYSVEIYYSSDPSVVDSEILFFLTD